MTQQLTEWQVEEWIRDYGFMLDEIRRLNTMLNKVDPVHQKLTATYGIESTLPKGSSGISQAELNQLDRREKRYYRYLEIVNFLDTAIDDIEDERERVIYDFMLEGMTYTEIAERFRCTRKTVRVSKESIISKIAKKAQKEQFAQKLKLIKDSSYNAREAVTALGRC
ncbi:LuxR C-terminal-related transcriptional regulator [Priestia flexa]|uniref:LuxR C-terminal-related transcriptional regulator n=1 Tax=Priestia flexa TaxID=86664 RepID=A0ABU4J285_9BACI|nr:LuxR C-terminal-related transcriptional regulator [Priestia flexa]MDW8515105.1 LuxR C-terminal-related transcriptional regulator [Priestia flexa]